MLEGFLSLSHGLETPWDPNDANVTLPRIREKMDGWKCYVTWHPNTAYLKDIFKKSFVIKRHNYIKQCVVTITMYNLYVSLRRHKGVIIEEVVAPKLNLEEPHILILVFSEMTKSSCLGNGIIQKWLNVTPNSARVIIPDCSMFWFPQSWRRTMRKTRGNWRGKLVSWTVWREPWKTS